MRGELKASGGEERRPGEASRRGGELDNRVVEAEGTSKGWEWS